MNTIANNTEQLFLNCIQNKNKKWYINAFKQLITYYKYVRNNRTTMKELNIIGLALNCIFNDLNRIPTEFDMQSMDNNTRNGTCDVQRIASDYLINNYDIIQEIISFWSTQLHLFNMNNPHLNSHKKHSHSKLHKMNNNNRRYTSHNVTESSFDDSSHPPLPPNRYHDTRHPRYSNRYHDTIHPPLPPNNRQPYRYDGYDTIHPPLPPNNRRPYRYEGYDTIHPPLPPSYYRR